MKRTANSGLSKVYWVSAISLLILVVLAAILWWYDGYLLHVAE